MNIKDITIPESVQEYLALTLEEDRTGQDLTAEVWERVCREISTLPIDWAGVCQQWAGTRASTDNRIEMNSLYDIIDEILTEQEHYDGACGGTDNSCPLCEEEEEL